MNLLGTSVAEIMGARLKQREQFTCRIYAWYLSQISPLETFLRLICPWYEIILVLLKLFFFASHIVAMILEKFLLFISFFLHQTIARSLYPTFELQIYY